MRINHILFRTTDLERMVTFLENVIGLHQGYRPPFQFPGAWMYSNDVALFHLVEVTSGEATTGNIDHVAIEGADYDTLVKNLESHAVSYNEQVVPDTRQRQLFVNCPEGLMLEMQFEANTETADRDVNP